jgi:hypothetical protein
MLATQGLRHPTDSSRFVRVLLSASLLASSGCAPNDGHSRSRITVLEANHAGGSGSRVSFEGRTVNGWGQAMNGSFERRGAGNRHGACSGAGPLGGFDMENSSQERRLGLRPQRFGRAHRAALEARSPVFRAKKKSLAERGRRGSSWPQPCHSALELQ